MKLMVVNEDPVLKESLNLLLLPLGYDLIGYTHPVKGIDNLDEVCPDGVIINGTDFPRHWKTFTAHLRFQKDFILCPVILLHTNQLTAQEYTEITELRVTSLEKGSRISVIQIRQLTESLLRCGLLPQTRADCVKFPGIFKDLGFIFSHPYTGRLISGALLCISASHLIFKPDLPELTSNLDTGAEVSDASIILAGKLLTLTLQLEQNMDNLYFKVVYCSGQLAAEIHSFVVTSLETFWSNEKKVLQSTR